MTLLGQADMGTIETATKLFGPMGAVCVVLCGALVYVFRLYHAETRARIEDAKASQRVLDQMVPYLAKLARRINRVSRTPEDSDHPPPVSRARIPDADVEE
jgi:hypothetical protein